jgi:gluconate 5-dehydrogenase
MSTSLFDLTGKVALVTGSSRGLGRVFAKGLAKAGAHVILNGRSKETLDTAVRSLRDEGLDVDGVVFDVLDKEAIETAVMAVEDRHGPIGILVNNAGVQKRAPPGTPRSHGSPVFDRSCPDLSALSPRCFRRPA